MIEFIKSVIHTAAILTNHSLEAYTIIIFFQIGVVATLLVLALFIRDIIKIIRRK